MKSYAIATIYKITSPNTENIYIGSTSGKIKQRKNQHTHEYKKYIEQNSKYCSSFDIIQCGSPKIEIVNIFTNITLKELRRKEGETIKATPNCINKYIAGRTHAEYYIDKKEEIYLYKKTQHECDCGGHYSNSNKNLHDKTKRHIAYMNIF